MTTHLATCQLCGETTHAQDILNHIRLFHPDIYEYLDDITTIIDLTDDQADP